MTVSVPRSYSLVKLSKDMEDWLKAKSKSDSPLLQDSRFIFLGEIPNMPGHCVVAAFSSGKLISGYHTDNFVEIDPEND